MQIHDELIAVGGVELNGYRREAVTLITKLAKNSKLNLLVKRKVKTSSRKNVNNHSNQFQTQSSHHLIPTSAYVPPNASYSSQKSLSSPVQSPINTNSNSHVNPAEANSPINLPNFENNSTTNSATNSPFNGKTSPVKLSPLNELFKPISSTNFIKPVSNHKFKNKNSEIQISQQFSNSVQNLPASSNSLKLTKLTQSSSSIFAVSKENKKT